MKSINGHLIEFDYLDKMNEKTISFMKLDLHIKSSIYYSVKQ